MLRMYLEEVADKIHKIVLVEAPVTFGGDPKPLLYKPEYAGEWADKVIRVTAEIPRTDNPWVREYAQRDAGWQAILDAGAALDDVVIIGDVDEIPSAEALRWRGWPVTSLWLRTALYAVDWLVPSWHPLPPMTVMATVRWLKSQQGQLARVREQRGAYPVIRDGGWHFSWLGGPEVQALKLATGTSHYELRSEPEAVLINSGARWRDGASGGGIPVEPAVIDSTWPAYIREHRCPETWFRPEDGHWVKPASDDPPEVMDYLWSGYPPGTLAFEVGANQGHAIPRMLKRYGRVIGFEPYAPNWKLACLMGGDVRLMAVSDHDGTVTMTNIDDQFCSDTHESATRMDFSSYAQASVPCVTLDTVMDSDGLPDFINVDVEGHELKVLQGAMRLLKARRTSWLIEFHSRDQQEQCALVLDEAGYDVHIVRHPHYAPGSQFYDQHGWMKAMPSAAD
jgi:FkbM family methyltransferase